MLILGLDAAAGACGAALLGDGAVLAAARLDAGDGGLPRATGRLLPLVARVLEDAGASPAALDAVAVTVGPGAYSGVRAAVATAQGLALAAGCRLVPIGTLEALAYAAGPRPDPVAPCLDARRGRLYAALYGPVAAGGGEPPPELRPPALVQAADWLAGLPRPVFLTGPGVRVLPLGYPAQEDPEPEGSSGAATGSGGTVAGLACAPEELRRVDPCAVANLGLVRLRQGGSVAPAALQASYVSRPQIGPAAAGAPARGRAGSR